MASERSEGNRRKMENGWKWELVLKKREIHLIFAIIIIMMMMTMMLSRKEEAADNDAATIGSYYAQTHPIITQHPTRDHTSSPAYHFNLTSAESHYTIFIIPKPTEIKVYHFPISTFWRTCHFVREQIIGSFPKSKFFTSLHLT